MCELFTLLCAVCEFMYTYKLCMCLSVRLSVCKFTDVYMKVPRLIFSLSPPQAQGGTEMY